MKTIVNYEIITNINHFQIVENVKEGIRNGWQPLGSLSTCITNCENSNTGDYVEVTLYSQAMVLYEN